MPYIDKLVNLEPPKLPDNKPTLELSGKILGDSPRYRVGSKISEGAFGQVYEVESMSTGNKYAMKILKPTSGNISEFNRELTAYELLSSKKGKGEKEPVGCYEYIVCLIDAFIQPIDGKKYYVFVLELMDNDLRALFEMDITTKDSDIMLFYMKTLLEGLAYIHSKGMAHNDIKLENILLKSYGDKVPIAKYADFGISCTDETQPDIFGTLLKCGKQGSLLYVSPDNSNAYEKDITLDLSQKDDIWALGIVFRTLATGNNNQLPFENINELILKDGEYTNPDDFINMMIDNWENNEPTIPVVYDTTEFVDTDEGKSQAAFRDRIVREVIELMSAVKAEYRPSAEELLNIINNKLVI